MATPTLQDVLAAVPAVAQLVNEMTELAPGVPASQQNLGVLFACMQKDVNQEYPFPDGCLVMLDLDFKKEGGLPGPARKGPWPMCAYPV